MPSFSDHQAQEFVKLLYIGASGTGKTGSLLSLMQAGYKIRVIDLDAGLDALYHFSQANNVDLNLLEYVDVRDKWESSAMGPVVKRPQAFRDAMKYLDKWEDGSNPAEWGSDTILVIDSLTNLGKAAYEWARGMDPSNRDKRQWFNTGQQAIDSFLAALTDSSFKTNVIVCTHIDLVTDASGMVKGFASSLGSALGPKIPRYFNNMVAAESKTMGRTTKRIIKTIATSQLDLKTAAPMKIDAEYPLETGLATIFKKLTS